MTMRACGQWFRRRSVRLRDVSARRESLCFSVVLGFLFFIPFFLLLSEMIVVDFQHLQKALAVHLGPGEQGDNRRRERGESMSMEMQWDPSLQVVCMRCCVVAVMRALCVAHQYLLHGSSRSSFSISFSSANTIRARSRCHCISAASLILSKVSPIMAISRLSNRIVMVTT